MSTNRSYRIREAIATDAENYHRFMRRIADEPNNGVLFHAGEFNFTVEETRQRIIDVYDHDNRMILVAVDKVNRVVGELSASASHRKAALHSVWIGITGDAKYRGQGIGTALMKTVIAWATDNPIVHRLELEVFTDNLPAIKLYLKLGFVIEGTKYKAYRKHGQFKDAYMMAILFEGKE